MGTTTEEVMQLMSEHSERRSAVFERVVDVAAVLSVAAFACSFSEQIAEYTEHAEIALTAVFVVEVVRRLSHCEWRVREFVRSRANVFDSVVVTLAFVLPLVMPLLPLLQVLPAVRVLRATHLASHVRHAGLARMSARAASRGDPLRKLR